jgi:hypothetical protein
MKAKKRGTLASKDEIKFIVEAFMEGASLSDIAKNNYRSTAFIKSIVEKLGVPERLTGDDKYGIELLPESCIAEEFSIGEIAWSAKYHVACKILKRLPDEKYMPKYGCPCYDIYVFEETEGFTKGGFYASAPAYDLGSLNHLKEYGVNITGG